MKHFLLFVPLLLAGCATAMVDSEVDPTIPKTTSFYILPSNQLAQDPMRAKQIIGLLYDEMIKQGFTPAKDGPSATLGVIVDLTKFPKESYTSTTAMPITGLVSSGGYSNFSGTTKYGYSPYNSSSFSGSVYTPPQYGTVGMVPITRTSTYYPVGIRVSAANMNLYRATKRANTAWISVIVSSPTSPDTRAMVPKLMKALGPWLGKDSGKTRKVYLN